MLNLIIADDELPIRQNLAKYIPWDELGFNIVGVFSDGAEIIEYIGSNPVDVIFTDIIMDNVSGIDVAKYVYDNKLPIKIVFCSAHQEFELAKMALNYNVFNYVLKPTNLNEINTVFTQLYNQLNTDSKTDNELFDTGKISSPNIKMAIEYILSHYAEAISLNKLAHITYLSPTYLSKIFKQETGKTFSDFLTDIRLKKSIELLKNIELKIYEVSYKIGYQDTKYFIKIFKKHYGYTPSQYRMNLIRGLENE